MRYYSIVKYFDKTVTYQDGCGDDLVSSHTFIQCDIRKNRFSDVVEGAKALRIVHAFNPTVSYGLAAIDTDSFGFITADIPTRVGVLKRDQKAND